MNPERVDVTFSIIIASNTHKNRTFFPDEWDFTVGRYVFARVNEDEVSVSFSFDAVLKRYDEQGRLGMECPSEYLPEYQEFEEEIEVILDLLSLDTGIGIQVKEESFLFSSATCKDNEFKNIHPILPSVTRELYPQFSRPLTENDKELRLALRLYRQAISTNDPREQMAKLFAALEQLFPNKREPIFSGEEIEHIKIALETLTISSEKKNVLLNRVRDSRKSPTTLIVENIELMYENELISENEKRKLVGTWNKYKSAITHGEIVSKRDENFDYVVAEIDTIVEAILKRGIEHRMLGGGHN
ncbi:MAG: hypothetical protein ABI758_07090 [Candidatus Woesebacteria bacterium]